MQAENFHLRRSPQNATIGQMPNPVRDTNPFCAGCSRLLIGEAFTCIDCVDGIPSNFQMVCRDCLRAHRDKEHGA